MSTITLKDVDRITLTKNRGWRGLAELVCINSKATTAESRVPHKMIFSFSQDVWDDMLKGYIVTQDEKNYYIIQFNNTEYLPKGQRSVLLKHFTADIIGITAYKKSMLLKDIYDTSTSDAEKISHFITNQNNHTTSDWNNIGIRVIPAI